MSTPYGHTRTRVAARHALIAPDGHVKSCVPGFTGAEVTILISEGMGAKVTQMLATFESGGSCSVPANSVETFGYVLTGAITAKVGADRKRCLAGGFFFAPAGHAWALSAPNKGTRLCFFQKTFEPAPASLAGRARSQGPKAIIGDAPRIKGQPFLGDPDARLQVLLPDIPAYDMAVNIFTYQPGATLPFVETHIMEHALLMLAGQGLYRLEDSWYPVAEGDAIWMAPYCPQWFVAIGKKPASYLYYKDVNRAAH